MVKGWRSSAIFSDYDAALDLLNDLPSTRSLACLDKLGVENIIGLEGALNQRMRSDSRIQVLGDGPQLLARIRRPGEVLREWTKTLESSRSEIARSATRRLATTQSR